jgi:hypothetical protein
MTKIFNKYDALLKGDRPWQKGDINGLKKQLGGWGKSSLTQEQIDDLRYRSNYCERFCSDDNRDRCFAITEEQRQQGVAWLLERAFRKDGEPRIDKRVGEKLTSHALNVIKGFRRFEFAGFYCRDHRNGRYDLEAIYRCHGAGGFFDYYYDRDLPDRSAFEILKEVELAPELAPCSGCTNLHGIIYNGTMMVCGLHPFGWESGDCPDWKIA